MLPFEIHESVQAYFQEADTRAVVDALVTMINDPDLPDMDRSKLTDLSEGVMLACQVRSDFVEFMADIWKNTFGAALEKIDLNEFFPENCTISEVWKEWHFWSYVTRGDDLERSHFDLTVDIDSKRPYEVTLRIWRYNDDDELQTFSSRLKVPDCWQRITDEGEQRLESTAKVTMESFIDNPDEALKPLKLAASAIVPLIAKLLAD
ncbi:hypothetical protein BFP70_08705 [Thioclava sp. SK-1]|uniref:hypothetical protein n=1 Tax=Thioclava sp. SK-1 TaxID=1889770 RepID=UPI000823FD8D|nr:hypothetical protein [Thioclava sp. SK-1]OCX65687.1 hypothetical protein BFP70_08705 [Thioclava sp. SK-1]